MDFIFQEFIPCGRQAVESHPGPAHDVTKLSQHGRHHQQSALADNFLLHRLENISLTGKDSQSEFWHVREEFQTVAEGDSFLYPVYENTEDELYVRGQTAVWSRGVPLDTAPSVPYTCYSMDGPIKFAFFCPRNFLKQNPKFRQFDVANQKKSSFYSPEHAADDARGICLIDTNSMRTFLADGEDFLSCLEFPVADVWPLRSCVLFEREATTTTIDSRAVAMPRLFSLRHPLEEMSPVLIKYGEYLGYFSNQEHKIIFCDDCQDLILLYDLQNGRHFAARLRKASEDEINYVGETSEQTSEYFSNATTSHLIPPGGGSFLLNKTQSQQRLSSSRRLHTSLWNNPPTKSTFPQSNSNSFHHNHPPSTPQNNPNRSSTRYLSPLVTSQQINSNNISRAMQSPLTRLHSSIRHNSFSMQDARNYGQAEPAQPIYPEFCLETVWLEDIKQDRLLEPATRGFYHTDWIGQRYLCYLLPRQGRLYLIEMLKDGGFGLTKFIDVRKAICLPVSG